VNEHGFVFASAQHKARVDGWYSKRVAALKK